jgi:hypothetical protein
MGLKMSNARIACIGALLGPLLCMLLFWLDTPFEKIFTDKALIQAHLTGALLAVALFGK